MIVGTTEPTEAWSSGRRNLATFLLVIHLFALFVALTSNRFASPLTWRLRQTPGIRPYLQLLGIDSSYAFHLTGGYRGDVDHAIELNFPSGSGTAETRLLPDFGIWPSARYWRYDQLARAATPTEDEPTDAEILLLRSIAKRLLNESGAGGGIVRTRQHRLLNMEFAGSLKPEERNPYRKDLYAYPYSANLLVLDHGEVDLAKIESTRDAAPAAAQP